MKFRKDKLYVISRVSEEGCASYAALVRGDVVKRVLDCDGGCVIDRDPTVEELVEYLDLQAERENHHYLVGVHRPLAALIEFHGGEAHAILMAIALCGGLEYLNK